MFIFRFSGFGGMRWLQGIPGPPAPPGSRGVPGPDEINISTLFYNSYMNHLHTQQTYVLTRRPLGNEAQEEETVSCVMDGAPNVSNIPELAYF